MCIGCVLNICGMRVKMCVEMFEKQLSYACLVGGHPFSLSIGTFASRNIPHDWSFLNVRYMLSGCLGGVGLLKV